MPVLNPAVDAGYVSRKQGLSRGKLFLHLLVQLVSLTYLSYVECLLVQPLFGADEAPLKLTVLITEMRIDLVEPSLCKLSPAKFAVFGFVVFMYSQTRLDPRLNIWIFFEAG
ncbi:hypothetical protein D3C81_1759790 [compost metagenome]